MTDILAIGAHPDDVELSCGGWLALASQRGQSVVILDLTRGELSTNGSPAERAQEAQAAAAVLGVRERRNAALPDGGLWAGEADQVDAVVAQIRALTPALVLGPWSEDRHPDHGQACALVHRALFLAGLAKHRPDLGAPHRATRWIQYPQRQEVRPDFVVDISAAVDHKRRAIDAHATQFGGAATLLNSPLGRQAWDVRDRYWGASIGVSHGEPYVIGGPVPVDDPLALFANRRGPTLVPPR